MHVFTKHFLLILILLPAIVFGKPIYSHPADTLPTQQISWEEQDSLISFKAHLRPLRQIAGAPNAFYTYFWELGDGNFSFNEAPQHTYSDSGEYMVRLFATNNYDDGKAPPTRPRKIKVKVGGTLASGSDHDGFFKKGQQLLLKVNRMPKPDEDMVCILGYKNPDDKPFSGSLVLFYNDKKFRKKNFGLSDLIKYHGEQTSSMVSLFARCNKGNEVPIYALNEVTVHGPNPIKSTMTVFNTTAVNLLQQKQNIFDNQNALHFDGLQAGEKRYVFAILHTTPEMIKDTNATVTLSAMMIPDDPQQPIQETNLELQIVASHDPNRMMLGNKNLNYRFMGKHKKQKYKVRFQNTGKGPAHTIDIGIKLPPVVEPGSLTVKDMYPECISCADTNPGQSCLDTLISKDSIHFIFKNIYLPGMRQKDVEDKDSTKGFVSYQLQFKEKPKKLPFWSQAGIIFDNNAPVYTNKMHTRFSPGISPAVITAYQMGFNDPENQNSSFILGGALSPYSPYRTYFQIEAYLEINGKSTTSQFSDLEKPRDTLLVFSDAAGQREAIYKITKSGKITKRNLLSLDIVPLEVRNNLNDWLSIGAGLWLKGNLYEKTTTIPQLFLIPGSPNSSFSDTTLLFNKRESINPTKHFSHINPGGFIDINIGKVRVGPAVGIRLYHFFSPNKTGLVMYAIWRL